MGAWTTVRMTLVEEERTGVCLWASGKGALLPGRGLFAQAGDAVTAPPSLRLVTSAG